MIKKYEAKKINNKVEKLNITYLVFSQTLIISSNRNIQCYIFYKLFLNVKKKSS